MFVKLKTNIFAKMREKIKDYEVERTILKIFIRHLKMNGLYVYFRWAVNYPNDKIDYFHVIPKKTSVESYAKYCENVIRLGGAFISASSIDDMVKLMRKNASYGKLKIENTCECQMTIMNIVNQLIHSCVEGVYANSPRKIEEFGSSLYEECCRTLIGDKYEDLTEKINKEEEEKFFKNLKSLYGMPYGEEFLKNAPPFNKTISYDEIDEMLNKHYGTYGTYLSSFDTSSFNLDFETI